MSDQLKVPRMFRRENPDQWIYEDERSGKERRVYQSDPELHAFRSEDGEHKLLHVSYVRNVIDICRASRRLQRRKP